MPANELELRRRRALYRATHRGSKELDFLLGRFAEASLGQMSETELGLLERLIETPDPDFAGSFYEGHSLDDPGLDALMQRIRDFHGYANTQIC